MPRFPDDHPIDLLRGRRRLRRIEAIRALAGRAEWLRGAIQRRASHGQPVNFYEDELRAAAQAIELFEAHCADPIVSVDP